MGLLAVDNHECPWTIENSQVLEGGKPDRSMLEDHLTFLGGIGIFPHDALNCLATHDANGSVTREWADVVQCRQSLAGTVFVH